MLQGMLSSAGWPGVLAAFGPWVGEAARGTVMGVWSTNRCVAALHSEAPY